MLVKLSGFYGQKARRFDTVHPVVSFEMEWLIELDESLRFSTRIRRSLVAEPSSK